MTLLLRSCEFHWYNYESPWSCETYSRFPRESHIGVILSPRTNAVSSVNSLWDLCQGLPPKRNENRKHRNEAEGKARQLVGGVVLLRIVVAAGHSRQSIARLSHVYG